MTPGLGSAATRSHAGLDPSAATKEAIQWNAFDRHDCAALSR
ncbi:hypothetical protein [Burkholderia vietnamiensis]|nr:hypothetical protein [Burkholderia vietnamiensis]